MISDSVIGSANSNGKLSELILYLCVSYVVSLENELLRYLVIVSAECLGPSIGENVGFIVLRFRVQLVLAIAFAY